MELTTETPPSVLQIASMFASLSAQHRRVVFAKGSGASTGNGGRRSVEGAGETFRALNANVATSTTKSAIFYSDRLADNTNGGRTRSRSSDSRPVCLDLKVIDNKTKFDHAKALFESLERQSRQEQRQRTPHNSKKRVASPSPTRSSSTGRNDSTQLATVGEPLATNNNCSGSTVLRAGPPALRTVTIAKRDQQIRPGITPDSCVVASETTTFVAMNSGGCSTTVTSTTRLVSASSSLASNNNNNNNSPSIIAPPPVPPKPKFIDSPRTSSESSSAVSSPSQIGAKAVFQRAWTLDATNSAQQRNGSSVNDIAPPSTAVTTAKEEAIASRHGTTATDSISEEAMEKAALAQGEPTIKGNGRSYYSRITQQRRVETDNGVSSWSSSNSGNGKSENEPKANHAAEVKPTEKSTSSAISVNTALSSNSHPPDVVSPQKPSSLYEPYWRAHRYGRQRLANGDAPPHERSLSPPMVANAPGESSISHVSPKRNYMLKTGSMDSGSIGSDTTPTLLHSKQDPGRLDIMWPPSSMNNATAVKSPTDENKDSGVGTDSPSTSTTDSRASSSMNAAPPAPFSNATSTSVDLTKTAKLAEECANVAFMTKEEASVLLSPSTRDVVLRETRGRATGDDGEVRSLPSHLSIPQDVDLKRLSMCSMDSSSEHGGLATDRYSIPDDMNVNVLADGHFWIEVAGLDDEPPPSPSEAAYYKKPSRVRFSNAPIKVYSTYTGVEYDRRNDDVDPVSASAEYELERRLEKMDIIEVELQKGAEGLGFSIIGMGVGADAGLEKLGIFVKSITPGGALHRDGRVCVCDQIVEVDGKSLVGVSQNYAASVLRSTSGTVRFKIGREKDLDNSEIAALIRQSLEQDRIMREQEEIFQRRFNGSGSGSANTESASSVEMQETANQQDTLPQYYHHQYNSYLLHPPDRSYAWNNHRSHESPLPSTDSVFAHDDEDETPEQLVDNNPHIERLMTQLREPPNTQATKAEKVQSAVESSKTSAAPESSSNSKRDNCSGEAKQEAQAKTESSTSDRRPLLDTTAPTATVAAVNSACTVDSLVNAKYPSTLPAFRDSQATSSNCGTQSTYTAAEDISRLLNDSAHSEDTETRFPSNGSEPETIYSATVQPSFTTCQSQRTAVTVPAPTFGQLRRNTPDLTSSTDSMNGSEIQLRINSLEAELTDIRQETDKYQALLNDSQSQYENLEKKYSRAKKLIKDYQDREKDLLDREEAHLRQLREKDQQYANLVKMLKDKVVELEKQLQDAHRKRASIVESAAAAAAAAATANISSISTAPQAPTDISPALAYQPAKKLDVSVSDRLPSDTSANTCTYVKQPTAAPVVRNVPIIVQTSLATEVDGVKNEKARLYGSDFGVPETELLDSTAAKSKAEVVKQSQIMAARALPTRRKETEVFIMCHHTLENAHSLRAHASGGHCGSGNCSNATASPCIGHADCSLSSASTKSTASPSKSNSSSSSASPLTPRRLTARAALLLRKKAAVNNASSAPTSCSQNRHLEVNSSTVGVGGGDLEKVPAVLTWTCDDVCRFLKSIGLEKYTPEFSINRMDGCKLLQLDGSKLKAMGVQNHSDRALIKKQIKEMKAQIERERKQLEKESRRLHKLEKEKRQSSKP